MYPLLTPPTNLLIYHPIHPIIKRVRQFILPMRHILLLPLKLLSLPQPNHFRTRRWLDLRLLLSDASFGHFLESRFFLAEGVPGCGFSHALVGLVLLVLLFEVDLLELVAEEEVFAF